MGNKNIVAIDTGSFATIPAHARYYAIPYEQTRQGIQKAVQHADAHQWAVRKSFDIDYRCRRRMITVMLGDRTNLVAFDQGVAQASSDGFSESDGIVSSTGAGAIDTAIVFQLFAARKSCAYVHNLLSKESGFLALAGKPNTLADIVVRTDEKAVFAKEVYSYQVLKSIGSLVSILGGLDAVVFIGEPFWGIKNLALDLVCQMKFLGLNNRSFVIGDEVGILTHEDSRVSAYYFEHVPSRKNTAG